VFGPLATLRASTACYRDNFTFIIDEGDFSDTSMEKDAQI
jgi:hypothetical protein